MGVFALVGFFFKALIALIIFLLILSAIGGIFAGIIKLYEWIEDNLF